MPDAEPTEAARRPGGRTARIRMQVVDAVRAELAEGGHVGLTMERVASRAGVHRATVYRRWRDVGGLLADVIAAAGEGPWLPPDTGSLRGDLISLNQEVQDSLVARPSLPLALMAASFHSEQAARAQTQLWSDRYSECEIIVSRSLDRGELPVGRIDARSLLIAATAPVYHHLVLLRADLDPHLPERAADAACAAAAAGVFSTEE